MNRLRGHSRQRGVALAIVLWFIAGMTLLVAGIVSHARVDTQMTQLHLAKAKTAAAGDGAITLMMADQVLGKGGGSLVREGRYRLNDMDVLVRLYPSTGLVDLNAAGRDVLAALFAMAGGTGTADAKFLADNVVEWRNTGASGLRGRKRFYAVEDLLRVQGFTRSMLDAVREYVVVGYWSDGTTDWALAPQAMLEVLEKTSPGKMNAVARRRENMGRSTGGAGARAGGRQLRGVYRADALINYGGKTWLRRRWVSMESPPWSNLPWRPMRTEPPRVFNAAGA